MKKKLKLYETWKYENMRELVSDIEKRHGKKIAFSFKKKANDKEINYITYETLANDVRCLATAVLERGEAGGRAALIGKLSYGWVCVYLALLSVGITVVPLDADWDADELAKTAARAKCTSLFCSSDVAKQKAEAICLVNPMKFTFVIDSYEGEDSLPSLVAEGRILRGVGNRSFENAEIDPEVLALLVFTSGTTGKGKGVMLSQKAILSNIWAGKMYLYAFGKTIGVLPPHHTFGSTICLLSALVIGNETYISSGLRYLPRELKEQKPEYMILVPLYLETFYRKIISTIIDNGQMKMFKRMMKVSKNLRKTGVDMRRVFFKNVLEAFGGNIKFLISGGAPLNPEIAEFYESVGVTVVNGYGITECAPLIACQTNDIRPEGSVGYPVKCNEVRIKEPNEDGEGEICVKGSNVMIGYYDDVEATAAAFTDDGYFMTGDYGKFDSDGWLYITGRLKNLIILSNGKNVYPEEIETSLYNIPGVSDAVVYEGVSRRGTEHNSIVAEIFPDEEYMKKNGIEDAYEYFKKNIETYNRGAVQYKRIGVIKIRDTDFPKNTLRKITRFKLDKSID